MSVLEPQALAEYCRLQGHFEQFVSQACFTDVDAQQAWCIVEDKRSLLIVVASDGCAYLLRGSYVGDLATLSPPAELAADADATLKALAASLNAHRVLTSHFRIQSVELLLLVFTGAAALGDPVAMPFPEVQRMPLPLVLAQCLRLQRAFEVFATQLTGECVKLERLHHVYVPETGCSTYIHHTVDTETPFSYLLLKGSQIASFQAGGVRSGACPTLNGPEKKGVEREVLTRQQLLTIVDEHFRLRQNLPVYRWTVAHNAVKGFRGGPEFQRENCPPLGARLRELRHLVARIPSHLSGAAEPRLSWADAMESADDYAEALEQAKQRLREDHAREVLMLRSAYEERLSRQREYLQAHWASPQPLLESDAVLGVEAAKAYTVAADGGPRGSAKRRGGGPSDADDAEATELQRLRKAQKVLQKGKAEAERQTKDLERQVEELSERCRGMEEELNRHHERLRAGQREWAEERARLEARVEALRKEAQSAPQGVSAAEVERRLVAAQADRDAVLADAEARHKAAEGRYKAALAAAVRAQETADAKQLAEQLKEQRRSLQQKHTADRQALTAKAAENLATQKRLSEELLEARRQEWAEERQELQAAVAAAELRIQTLRAELDRHAAETQAGWVPRNMSAERITSAGTTPGVVPRHHDHEAEPGADRKGDGDGAPMGAPQERLRDAPTCASDMHFDCEAQLDAQRKQFDAERTDLRRALEEQARGYEDDKARSQESYGRLLAQIREQFHELLRSERRTVSAQQSARKRAMLNHFVAVQARHVPRNTLAEQEAEQNRLQLETADDQDDEPQGAALDPEAARSPAPSAGSALRCASRVSAAAVSNVAASSGGVLTSLFRWRASLPAARAGTPASSPS